VNTAEQSQPLARRRIAWLMVKLAIFAVVLGFVVWALVDRFRQVDWANLHPDPVCLLASVALVAVSCVISGLGYHLLLAAFGYRVRPAVMLAVCWVAQLGKYVPGKVMSVAGGMWLLKKQNVPMPVGMAINVMLMGLYVVAGLAVAAPLMVFEKATFLGPLTWLGPLLVLAAAVVLLHPRVLVGAINFALKRIGQQPLPARPRLRDYAGPTAMVFLQWVLFGTAFWLGARALGQVPVQKVPFFICATATATTVGFLAFFAPAGLGVREGVLLVLLGPVLGPTTAVLVVVLRFLQGAVEVGLGGVGLIILRAARRRAAEQTL
jgi:hypothetical protein